MTGAILVDEADRELDELALPVEPEDVAVDVVDGDDTHETLVAIDDGRCHQTVTLELACDRLLVGGREDLVAVPVHDLLDAYVALGAQ